MERQWLRDRSNANLDGNIKSTRLHIRVIAETGMKAFRDVIDAVAPPIAEHEVIQVNLSHDMKGYEGVETLVYRALAKVSKLRALDW